MKLIFKEEIIQLDEQPSVEEIIEQINQCLGDRYYFSHLIIDGDEIYEQPEEYLSLRLEQIDQLEVVAKTAQELINDTLLSAEEYISRAKVELRGLAEGFYQNPTADHWGDFAKMVEGLQWLNRIITMIDQLYEKPTNWSKYKQLEEQLQTEVVHLQEAVENDDQVLIADLIQYELSPIYEALNQEITNTIDTEGKRYDLN